MKKQIIAALWGILCLVGPSDVAAGIPTDAKITFTPQEISYFLEIALKPEYGDDLKMIRKWQDDLRIKVIDAPSFCDSDVVGEVVAELNNILGGEVTLTLVEKVESANVTIDFVPQSHLPEGNTGHFWTWYTDTGEIYNAEIMVSIDQPFTHRAHVIREELTQILGLMNDSHTHNDSIFYQGHSDVTVFSPVDITLLKMLYHPDVLAGDRVEDVAQTIPFIGYEHSVDRDEAFLRGYEVGLTAAAARFRSSDFTLHVPRLAFPDGHNTTCFWLDMQLTHMNDTVVFEIDRSGLVD